MNRHTCEQVIQKALSYATDSCSFIFQGGEPTLAGADFYRYFVRTVRDHAPADLPIAYSIQTNGYRLSDDMLAVLKENGFLVGLSLDGNHVCHDAHRRDTAGCETFSNVARTARRLSSRHIDFNILTVVTPTLVHHVQQMFTFFVNQGYRYLQFISCLPPLGEDESAYVVTDEEYGLFLMQLFDLWFDELEKGNAISIRYFDNLIALLRTGKAEACGLQGRCSTQYVVESDGSVYPCDFYVMDRFSLGNLTECDIYAIDRSRKRLGFIENSRNQTNGCRLCPYRLLCGGGCRRERRQDGRYRYCQATQKFLAYALPRLLAIAEWINP